MATSAPGFKEETSFLADLPKVTWWKSVPLLHWKGFWHRYESIKGTMAIENQFKPLPSDILLVSFPKTGTTWLKALTVTILGHNSESKTDVHADPLETHNPHELIPFLEGETFGDNPSQDIDKLHSPRVFSTHLPYSILPEHIKTSGCRVIYISRNPADAFVSSWHFYNKRFGVTITLKEAFDEFCRGVVYGGPFFDHVLEYWKEREKDNVLFVTNEELKEDPNKHVERLAKFLGCSLNPDEIEQVIWKTSHERLSNLDINTDKQKRVLQSCGVQFSSFFRRGVVGDAKNYLTLEMMERLNTIVNQRWGGSGLEFKLVVVEPNKESVDKI